MTDASSQGERRSTDSSEGTLFNQLNAIIQHEEATFDVVALLESKGVPLDALEHGRMEVVGETGLKVTDLKCDKLPGGRMLLVIVPDTEATGEASE